MRLAIITKKNSYYGFRFLNLLKKENIPVDLVVVVKQPIGEPIRLFARVKRRIGFVETFRESINIIYKNYLDSKIKLWRGLPLIRKYDELCNRVYNCSDPNNRQTVMELVNLKPDFILLAESGIIKDSVIKIPTQGILNSHPGILPRYRGIDVVYWALFNDDFENIGSTVHLVNEGIDTGPIVYKRKYNFTGKEDLNTLENYIYEACLDLFIYTLRNFKSIKPIDQDLKGGKQYYKMPMKVKKELKKKLINIRYFHSKGMSVKI